MPTASQLSSMGNPLASLPDNVHWRILSHLTIGRGDFSSTFQPARVAQERRAQLVCILYQLLFALTCYKKVGAALHDDEHEYRRLAEAFQTLVERTWRPNNLPLAFRSPGWLSQSESVYVLPCKLWDQREQRSKRLNSCRKFSIVTQKPANGDTCVITAQPNGGNDSERRLICSTLTVPAHHLLQCGRRLVQQADKMMTDDTPKQRQFNDVNFLRYAYLISMCDKALRDQLSYPHGAFGWWSLGPTGSA